MNRNTPWVPLNLGDDTPISRIGTSLMGEVICTYLQLVEIFGPPNFLDALNDELGSSGDSKVSTEWMVTNGIYLCTLYEYKGTSVYNDDLPSVEELRSGLRYPWHIGAADSFASECLEEWLYKTIIRNNKARRPKKVLKTTKKFKKRFEDLIIE